VRIITIANYKGGSAKTTTVVNLAAALGAAGKSVLVLDIDPQANASMWLGVGNSTPSVVDLFRGTRLGFADTVQTSATGVRALHSNPHLMGLERELATEIGAETLLKHALASLGGFDFVLIDTPPTFGLLTVNALAACTHCLVPVEAHVLALAGVARLVEMLTLIRSRLNPSLVMAGLVACRVSARSRHNVEVVEKLRERFGADVFTTEIRENVRLAEAPSFAQPIASYAARSRGADDYRALATELLARTGRV
jgi:chromosome partitioning protein